METLLLIGLGGFAGANVRFLVSNWATQQISEHFPYGTLLVNFTGSLMLGLFIPWVLSHSPDSRMRLLVATGFFGAYTTFSTYAIESVALWQTGNWTGAVGNVLVTNLLCLTGAAIGLAIGSRL